MRGSKSTIIAVAILLTLPLASATWFTRGSYEPDTLCDTAAGCTTHGGVTVAGGYMFNDADTSAGAGQVYFNGYFQAPPGLGNSVANPNSEIAGSRIVTSKFFYAYLGVWKDCNEDGYVGAGSGALHFYKPGAVAINTVACPDGSIFNRNGWVYEFIWIGRGGHVAGDQNYPSADDQRWINDTEAAVWIDFNQPGTAPSPSCPINPWPSGTSGSTGGLLMNFDCFTARRVAGAINDGSDTLGLGIGFEDTSAPQRSSSPLNQDFPVHPWNDPYGGENNNENDTGLWDENSQRDWSDSDNWDGVNDEEDTAFTVWDCSQPSDQVGPFQVAKADPSVDDPVGGSYYDSVNHTERGMLNILSGGDTKLLSYDGPLGRADEGGGTVSNNCDSQRTTWGHDSNPLCGEPPADGAAPRRFTTTWCLLGIENFGFAPTEAEFTASGVKPRRINDDVMSFSLGPQPPRGGQLPSDVNDPRSGNSMVHQDLDSDLKNATGSDSGDLLNTTLGKGYQFGPDFRGPLGAGSMRPTWLGSINWLRANCCVLINTDTLQPHSAQYQTFYARVGAATTTAGAVTAKGTTSVYGAEWCQGATTGESTNPKGFDCDATHWWNPAPPFSATQRFTANGHELGAKAGDLYNLRDIDCYDGTLVRGTPARASLVDLSVEGPCVDAP